MHIHSLGLRRIVCMLGTLALLSGCAGTNNAPERPVLLVAYTPNVQVRTGFENQLQSDLQTLGIRAVQSVDLIPDFRAVAYPAVLEAARTENAFLILMVRRLITDAPVDADHQPVGIERHRTLTAYFATTDRNRLPTVPPPGRQVIEVDAYRTGNGGDPELIWHGFSWVDFSGDLQAAIRETAEIISTNMAAARAARRNGSSR